MSPDEADDRPGNPDLGILTLTCAAGWASLTGVVCRFFAGRVAGWPETRSTMNLAPLLSVNCRPAVFYLWS